jgi:hypothetical protein
MSHQTLKLVKQDSNFKTTITLKSDGLKHKYFGYKVGELPKRFAFIYNEENDQEGIYDWFNYKGLTFISQYYFNM